MTELHVFLQAYNGSQNSDLDLDLEWASTSNKGVLRFAMKFTSPII